VPIRDVPRAIATRRDDDEPWADRESSATPPASKRRRLSPLGEDNSGAGLDSSGGSSIFHPQYVPRRIREPQVRSRGGGSHVRRLIIEEEQNHNDDVEEEEDEDDEDEGEFPGLLTDDEEDDEDGEELRRLQEKECIGCRMILGMETGMEVVAPHMIQKFNEVMAVGKKTGNLYTASQYVEREFHNLITKMVNLERRARGVADIPKWTEESIRKHYTENHCDSETISLYNELKAMRNVADALQKYELIYYDRSGPLEYDEESGRKRKSIVKRCRPAVARALFSMREKLVVTRLRVKREMAMDIARTAKLNGGRVDQKSSIFDDLAATTRSSQQKRGRRRRRRAGKC